VAGIFGSSTPSDLNTSQYSRRNPGAGIGWEIWRRDMVANQYRRLAATETMNLDTGYWVRTFQNPRQGNLLASCPNSTTPAPVTQAQGCSSNKGCRAITLTSAATDLQNIVENPFPYAVDWSTVRVRIDGNTATYTPSQAAGVAGSGNAPTPVISNVINIRNGTAYDTYSDTGPSTGNLAYFKSFWVKVLAGAQGHAVELLIPKVPGNKRNGQPRQSSALPAQVNSLLASNASPASRSAALTSSWFVRLEVDDYEKGWKHHTTLLGQQAGASYVWDPQDLPAMPPFGSPYLYLTLPRPNWGAKAGDYATDFRPAGALTAGEWPFELRASEVGSTVYLRREGDAAILRRSLLVNTATGATIRGDDPRWSGNGVPVRVAKTTQKFVWRYLGP